MLINAEKSHGQNLRSAKEELKHISNYWEDVNDQKKLREKNKGCSKLSSLQQWKR